MPAKKAGEAERDEADNLRGVADELRPLRVVAHRVAHAPERRAGESVDRGVQTKHQTAMR